MLIKLIHFTLHYIFGRPNQRIVCDMDEFLEGMGSLEKHKRV